MLPVAEPQQPGAQQRPAGQVEADPELGVDVLTPGPGGLAGQVGHGQVHGGLAGWRDYLCRRPRRVGEGGAQRLVPVHQGAQGRPQRGGVERPG